ncbi:MAG: hypothetical protein OSJ83_07610 [Clostridia bacterium]|nr:hypothetical protein [Clostridia bacterium]
MKNTFRIILTIVSIAILSISTGALLIGCKDDQSTGSQTAVTARIADQAVGKGGSIELLPIYSDESKSSRVWTFEAENDIVSFNGMNMTGIDFGTTKVRGTDENGVKAEFTVSVVLSVTKGRDISACKYEIVQMSGGGIVSSLDQNVAIVENNIVYAVGNGNGKLLVYDDDHNTAAIHDITVSDELPYGLTVKAYDGSSIVDFRDNIFAFTVTADAAATVKIDGETSTSAYEYGEHIVSVEKDGIARNFAVSILTPSEDGDVYEIYATYATLPTLYSGLNMVLNDNEKFIWFGRSGTLSVDILEANDKITLSEYISNTSKLAIDVVNEIKDYAVSVLKKDRDAHFRLYVDDFRHWIEITTLCELGLNSDRYEVYYCSDGTYTYTKQYSYRNGPFSTYQNVVAKRNEMIENARLNVYANDDTDNYMNGGSVTTMDFNDDFIIAGASEKNIYYWAQYPEFVSSESKEIQAVFYDVIDKQLPELMYAALNAEQKNKFLELVNFDKATFDSTYFNKNNSKQYLIVTGTSPYTSSTYQYIQKVNAKYGEEYNIVFKPHPSAVPAGQDAADLADLGIDILPGRLPMEVILWVYPECKTGGYNSSLYMSAPKGNTLFFFAESKDSLSSPIKELFDLLFYNAEFMTLS